MRHACCIIATVLLLAGLCKPVAAQPAEPAQWIWFDEGSPSEAAAEGKVWFRKEYRAEEPSTGFVRIACDDHFVLWVNGQKIGAGGGDKSEKFSLSGFVGRGTNVFAVEATNQTGRAGLYIDAEIRGQSGRRIACLTNADWKATRTAPVGEAWLHPRFDDAAWKPAKALGPHADAPWKSISIEDNPQDRFQVAAGFEVKQIADANLVGSLVAMTWGNRGRLIASRERGPILIVVDDDHDGVYDKATEFTSEVKNCQGLCLVGDDLYAVGDGPNRAGIYRLPDRDHDDKADEVVFLAAPQGGMGEHGPHDIVFGPDGWLYHNLGNHAGIKAVPEPTTPCRNFEEGYLLEPKFEDAGGHAVGIKAPGGTIWRFTPDGTKWWLETNGFRNQYDIAFNALGDLYTFDSDMEWDVGLPWYRPVRINHCVSGAEFGWRSGAAVWPDWYFDSLPTSIDVGRGSPTGIVFYEHKQFPPQYHGALLNCDWSMGRIIVAFLKQEGATYRGTVENLVTGNPLNVSDIEVDRDGSVVFCTGGRNTQGGIYRVSYIGAPAAPQPAAETLADALAVSQPQSAWAREIVAGVKDRLGERWAPELAAVVKQGSPAQKLRALTCLSQFGPKPSTELLVAAAGDSDPQVRAFAVWLLGDHTQPEVGFLLGKLLADPHPIVRRRACEAFLRNGLEAPVEPLVAMLADPDRWLRFAARLALERVPAGKWESRVLGASNVDVVLAGLLAMHRNAREVPPTPEILDKLVTLLEQPNVVGRQRIDALRMLQLLLIAGGQGPAVDRIAPVLLRDFQSAPDTPADETALALKMETARLIAWRQVPGAAGALVSALEQARTPQLQMHYALCLRYLHTGWTFDQKQRVFDWYEHTRDWEGGNSLQGYLRNIMGASLEHFTPPERRQLLDDWRKRPFATRVVISKIEPEQVADFDGVIARLLAEPELQAGAIHQELGALGIEALGKSAAPGSQALLRKLFDENADHRDPLARSLARHPTPENIPYLFRSLPGGDATTVQVCLQALNEADVKSEKPAELRAVILAGLKLGGKGGLAAANLLKKWTGSAYASGDNARAALAHYQKWYRQQYPDEPAAEPARDDASKTKYTFQQLIDFLEKSPQGGRGDVARGRQVFAKANCIKCHRFLKEGEGVGPDLTTVRRRFQRKEIVESILFPSQVISDQYLGLTVETRDGFTHTGMPLPNQGEGKVVLLLPDATKLEIPDAKIESKTKARVSVMPEGLLKELSLDEIADLFAFLETSKNNVDPGAASAAAK